MNEPMNRIMKRDVSAMPGMSLSWWPSASNSMLAPENLEMVPSARAIITIPWAPMASMIMRQTPKEYGRCDRRWMSDMPVPV